MHQVIQGYTENLCLKKYEIKQKRAEITFLGKKLEHSSIHLSSLTPFSWNSIEFSTFALEINIFLSRRIIGLVASNYRQLLQGFMSLWMSSEAMTLFADVRSLSLACKAFGWSFQEWRSVEEPGPLDSDCTGLQFQSSPTV